MSFPVVALDDAVGLVLFAISFGVAKALGSDFKLLILDEPTNHIDIDTREILENALIDYDGTILFVSHDRYFINKVATHIVELKNKSLYKYIGNK